MAVEGLKEVDDLDFVKAIIAIWEGDKCEGLRYKSCPHCKDKQEKNANLIPYDSNLLDKIENTKIKEWYPTNKFYYPDGRPFKKKEHYESVDELFTKRNLQALAWLIEAIEDEPKKDLRDFLKIAFTSMLHLCTRMKLSVMNPYISNLTQMSLNCRYLL